MPVNDEDKGKLIGKKGIRINTIKKTFNVQIYTSSNPWTIIGIERDIDCAIKAFNYFKDGGIKISEAKEVCIQKVDSFNYTNVINPEQIDIPREVDYTRDPYYTDQRDNHKLGIIIPMHDSSQIVLEGGGKDSQNVGELLSRILQKISGLNHEIFIVNQLDKEMPLMESIPDDIIESAGDDTILSMKTNYGALINYGAQQALQGGCDYIII